MTLRPHSLDNPAVLMQTNVEVKRMKKPNYRYALPVCLALFLVALGLILVAGFVEGARTSTLLANGGIVVVLLAMAAFVRLWKCPICGGPLPRKVRPPEYCAECGGRLNK